MASSSANQESQLRKDGLKVSLVCHFFKGKEVDWTLMAGTGL